MSDELHSFDSDGHFNGVLLPFALDDVIESWGRLRVAMAREVPEEFTRDEWAYLITFLDPSNLRRPFHSCFGRLVKRPIRTEAGRRLQLRLLRPRGPIAVWLPNNVSLLGPLALVLLGLTGNSIRLKAGSRSGDLTSALLEFARRRLPPGALADYLKERVRLDRFDRSDPRNQEMAAEASLRVVFGSDEAVSQIESFAHPHQSTGFSFSERQSEAWLEAEAASDDVLATLAKVFAVYGQAGCTSPRRVVLLGSDPKEAIRLRDRLAGTWTAAVPRRPAMHVASSNVLARQQAAALGWDAVLAGENSAVLAAGSLTLPPFDSGLGLPIVSATLEATLDALPPNIQTVGHAVVAREPEFWLSLLGRTAVKRFVPLGEMHHFGPVWDGWEYWRQAFEDIEVTL